MKTRTVLASAAAALLLASTAVANCDAQPMSRALHLHPGAAAKADDRVTLHLYNEGSLFKQVNVNGKEYTLDQHGLLAITAPAGTPVYAVSNVAFHRRGDVLLTVAPEMQNGRIILR